MGFVAMMIGLMSLSGLAGLVMGRRSSGPRPAAPAPAADPGRLKEEFLTTVSHELRTPLNAVLGWTELLRSGTMPPAEVARGLEVIERNARRELALVEELIAAAEPARRSDAWERVDLRELMSALIEGVIGAAAAAAIVIEHDPVAATGIGGPAEPVWVLGDRAGLRLAFRHILENAVKFTPAGGRVGAWLRQAGSRAVVEVTDTGTGIEPAAARMLFEPFRQQDGSRGRRHGGLGLGLTIAQRLIEAHGGRIDVRSDGLGRGATFLVTLPLLDAQL